MLFSLATIAFPLLSVVQATVIERPTTELMPTSDLVLVSPEGRFPVLNLAADSVTEHPSTTIGTAGEGNVTGDAVEQIYPAVIFLCIESGCANCITYDLSIQPHGICLIGGINFVSMMINQPSNEGLPFGVYVGPSGCGTFLQLPAVNTCYNAVNFVGWDFELID